MAGRDLDYTDGLSQEELMHLSHSRSTDYTAAEMKRGCVDGARGSQEDENLAKALAASRITAEHEGNLTRDRDTQNEYQRRVIAPCPKYEQELPSRFSHKEMYEILGLTEEEHLQLAILQSREQDDHAAEQLQEARYMPPTTAPDSDTDFLSLVPSSAFNRSKSVESEITPCLRDHAQDPWIDNPNCLYDPPPLDEQSTHREYMNRLSGILQAESAEDSYRTQHQVREATHQRGYEQSRRYHGHHRDSPATPTTYAHDTLRPEINPRVHSGRPYDRSSTGGPGCLQPDNVTRHLPQPSSSRTLFSTVPTSPGYSVPPKTIIGPSRHNGPVPGDRAQYIFKGPVTINHCCHDNEHELVHNSSAIRLWSSPRNPNCNNRDFQSGEINQTRQVVNDRHSFGRLHHSRLEHDQLYHSTPLSRQSDRQQRPSFPMAYYQQHTPLHEQTNQTLHEAVSHGLTDDDASSRGPPANWSLPHGRYIVESPPTRSQPRKHRPSHHDYTQSSQGYIWDL